MSQDPNSTCEAQEQDSQVDWVEPHLKYVFHFESLLFEF